MTVNYELADLFFKLSHVPAQLDAAIVLDTEAKRTLEAEAKSFLLTYEQTCWALEPDITSDALVESWLERQAGR